MSYLSYNGTGSGFAPGKEQYEKDFEQLRGTQSPYGHPIPTPLTGGQYFGKNYKTVKGNPNEPGWGNYVDPDHELVAYYAPSSSMLPGSDGYDFSGSKEGVMVLRRKEQQPAAAPAPAAETPKPYEIDTDAIGRAKDLATKAKDQYASSIPSLDPTRDPYSSAMAYGSAMQRSLLDGQAFFDAKAKANTTEIGEASKSALSRFFGTVKDIEVPNWRDYLNA